MQPTRRSTLLAVRSLVVLAAAADGRPARRGVPGQARPLVRAGRVEFGDSTADPALELMYVGTPKAWNQQNRSFGKYLGYRVLVGSAP